MLQYITLVLSEHEKRVSKENKNAARAKDFKYPPVLPIVFYDGATKWTAEKNFINRTELGSVFYKYIPKFEYELVDLSDYSEQELVRLGGMLSLIMLIDKISDEGNMNSLSKLPEEYIADLLLDMQPHLKKLLTDVITVLLTRINVPIREIEEVTDRIQRKEIQGMFAWADNYDVQETRRKAREEGLAEGREKGREEGLSAKASIVAENLLSEGDSIEKIVKVTGLTRNEVENLAARGRMGKLK